MKNQIIIISLSIIFIGVLSGCLSSKEMAIDYYIWEYEVNNDTILQVITFNGQIEITSWDGNMISMNATKKSEYGQNELDLIDINVIESSDKIEIESEYLGTKSSKPSVDMNIKVPHNVIIEKIQTTNDEIQISKVNGNITAMTSNGKINIQNVEGYISATTSNGGIEIRKTTGIRDLKSTNGKIIAEISDFKQDTTVSTSNGAIDVYLNPLLNADISMITSNGQISINGVPLNMTASGDEYLNGIIGNGGNLLQINTSNGDINLYEL